MDILTAKAVGEIAFSAGRRGYDMQEVDQFIERVEGTLKVTASEHESLRHDNAELQTKMKEAQVSQDRLYEATEKARKLEERHSSDVLRAEQAEAKVGVLEEQVASLTEELELARAAGAATREELENFLAQEATHSEEPAQEEAPQAVAPVWVPEPTPEPEPALTSPEDVDRPALKVLAAANRTADLLVSEAEEEARVLRAEAATQASTLLQDANHTASRLVQEAQDKREAALATLAAEQEELTTHVEDLRARAIFSKETLENYFGEQIATLGALDLAAGTTPVASNSDNGEIVDEISTSVDETPQNETDESSPLGETVAPGDDAVAVDDVLAEEFAVVPDPEQAVANELMDVTHDEHAGEPAAE